MRAPVDVPRLRDYLVMLAHAWLIIAVATLLSAGAVLAAAELRKPSYTASALVWASVAGDSSVYAMYYGGMAATAEVPTYVGLAKSRLVAQRAIEGARLKTTTDDLAGRVSADWVPGGANAWGRANSALLRVTVTNDNPGTAVKEVNAIAGNLMAVSRELQWHESTPTEEIQYKGPAAELVPIDQAKTAELVPTPLRSSLSIGAGIGFAVSVMIMLTVGIARGTVATRGQLNHVVKVATQGNT